MKINKLLVILIWILVISCGRDNKAKPGLSTEKSIDRNTMMAILDNIERLDRDPLIMRDSMGRIHGPESEEAQFYQKIAWKNQPYTIKRVKEILGDEGWPDTTLIGPRGNKLNMELWIKRKIFKSNSPYSRIIG